MCVCVCVCVLVFVRARCNKNFWRKSKSELFSSKTNQTFFV